MDRKEGRRDFKQESNVYRLLRQRPEMCMHLRETKAGQVGWGWIIEAEEFKSNFSFCT